MLYNYDTTKPTDRDTIWRYTCDLLPFLTKHAHSSRQVKRSLFKLRKITFDELDGCGIDTVALISFAVLLAQEDMPQMACICEDCAQCGA